MVAALNREFAQPDPRGHRRGVRSPGHPRLSAPAPASRCRSRIAWDAIPATCPNRRGASCRRRAERPEIGRISTLYRASVPQIYADIDRSKVLRSGVPLHDVNTTLGALLGSTYVNDFQQVWTCLQAVRARPEPGTGVTRSSSGCSSSAARTARWCRSTRSSGRGPRAVPSSPTASTCTARPKLTGVPAAGSARRRR